VLRKHGQHHCCHYCHQLGIPEEVNEAFFFTFRIEKPAGHAAEIKNTVISWVQVHTWCLESSSQRRFRTRFQAGLKTPRQITGQVPVMKQSTFRVKQQTRILTEEMCFLKTLANSKDGHLFKPSFNL
jgi:hypothetical protein